MPQSAAKRLWQAGFPEDSDAFFESYRTMRSVPEYALALMEDDMWCAGMHIIPQTISVRNTNIPAGMVAGVATESTMRKRGFAGELMRAGAELMREHGMALAVLDPFRESFYEPFGYRTGTVYRDRVCDMPQKAEFHATEDIGLLDGMYRRYIKGFSGYVVRTLRDWQFRLRDAQLDGASFFVLSPGCGSAYALASVREESLRVWELLGRSEDDEQKLLMALCAAYQKPVHYSVPAQPGQENTRHGAMYCPLDLKQLIETIPVNGEGSVKFCVKQGETVRKMQISAAQGMAKVFCHEEDVPVIDAGELFLILLGAGNAYDAESLDADTANVLAKLYPTCKTILFEQY